MDGKQTSFEQFKILERMAQLEFEQLNKVEFDKAWWMAEVEKCKADPSYFHEKYWQARNEQNTGPTHGPGATNNRTSQRADAIRAKYERAPQGVKTSEGGIIWENVDPFSPKKKT
jgi:hypothetical protein